MIDASNQCQLKESIEQCIKLDARTLDQLRAEIRPLKGLTHRIQPRSTTSISLVGTDGGNNQIRFDPFLVQLIRVVDSSNNEYCMEAVSPTTPVDELSARQFSDDGKPRTPLGEMMRFLNVSSLPALSHMIRQNNDGKPVSTSWVQVYRELVEWAVLFSLLKSNFGTDTLIVTDGLLRSKVFARDLFQRLLQGLEKQIEEHYSTSKRRIYIAGVAKHSKVLSRYQLAMALEGVLQTDYPAYVEVPRDVEEKAYIWSEFARGNDRVNDGGEINKFVGGKMFLVKFGSKRFDPVWPIDVFVPQVSESQIVMGSLLADSINGFPVPHYPRCLQKAHENAALIDFDIDILQDIIYEGIRISLGSDSEALDAFQLQDSDPSQLRYR